MQTIRVLNVLGALDVGGTEMRLLGLMPEQISAGVTHDFLCLSGNRGALAPQFEEFGCSVFPLELRTRSLPAIFRLLKFGEYKFVHSRVATFSGYILLIAFMAGLPGRIAHFHSDSDEGGTELRRRVQRFVGRALIRAFATHVLAVSPEAMSFSGIDPDTSRKHTKLVPGGVGVPSFDPEGRSGGRDSQAGGELHRVANVGRPAKDKRRELAARVVEACGTDFVIEFIGRDGPDLELVRRRASEKGLRVPVTHGIRSDVQVLLAEYDCLLSTSSVEGLPGVVLEALSVGTPVVTSRLSGAVWISSQIRGVFLVDVDAPVSDWAEAVRLACSVPPDVRREIRSDFQGSPFVLSAASSALASIYSQSE